MQREIPRSVSEELEKVGGVRGALKNIPERSRLRHIGGVFQSLSDPIRLAILYSLSATPLCVCLIRNLVKISDSKLSYHLSCLKKAGLITKQSEGKYIVYRITFLGKRMISTCDEIQRPSVLFSTSKTV
ncbi:MAG: metalloregulator ArsR/SmtB family transcription factor [Candidatus Bathyarchaeia archaeon]